MYIFCKGWCDLPISKNPRLVWSNFLKKTCSPAIDSDSKRMPQATWAAEACCLADLQSSWEFQSLVALNFEGSRIVQIAVFSDAGQRIFREWAPPMVVLPKLRAWYPCCQRTALARLARWRPVWSRSSIVSRRQKHCSPQNHSDFTYLRFFAPWEPWTIWMPNIFNVQICSELKLLKKFEYATQESKKLLLALPPVWHFPFSLLKLGTSLCATLTKHLKSLGHFRHCIAKLWEQFSKMYDVTE